MQAFGAQGAQDSDKVYRQFMLDVKEYGRQISEFGIDIQSLQPYEHLLALVAFADKVLCLSLEHCADFV